MFQALGQSLLKTSRKPDTLVLLERLNIRPERTIVWSCVAFSTGKRARRKQKAGGSKGKVWQKKKIHQNKKRIKEWWRKRLSWYLGKLTFTLFQFNVSVGLFRFFIERLCIYLCFIEIRFWESYSLTWKLPPVFTYVISNTPVSLILFPAPFTVILIYYYK